jgi:dihydrofolate reductase
MKSATYLSIVYPKSPWRAIRAVILSSIQARQVAGRQDIRITGGAQTIQQFLNAGLVDEFTIH